MSIEVVVIFKLDAARKNDDAEHLRLQRSGGHRDVHHGTLRGAAAQSLDEEQLLARREAAVLPQSVLPDFHRLATCHEEPTPRILHVQPAKTQCLARTHHASWNLQRGSSRSSLTHCGRVTNEVQVCHRFLLGLAQRADDILDIIAQDNIRKVRPPASSMLLNATTMAQGPRLRAAQRHVEP